MHLKIQLEDVLDWDEVLHATRVTDKSSAKKMPRNFFIFDASIFFIIYAPYNAQ